MAETYTIQQTMPTGKSHEKFGSEYQVKFVESEQTFALWFKKEPQPNDTIDGEINGNRFKKVRKEWNPDQKPAAPAKQYNNSREDGMRQGMAINNAAQYVAAISPEPLKPSEWARAVSQYARALYDASDLNAQPEASQDVKSVKDIFGVTN